MKVRGGVRMSLILLLSVQAAAVATPGWAMPVTGRADGDAALSNFDLARYRSQDDGGCAGGGGNTDVVVCGRRRARAVDRRMMDYWASIYTPGPIRAETGLGGGLQGRAYLEDAPMDRGAISHRALIGVRTRF